MSEDESRTPGAPIDVRAAVREALAALMASATSTTKATGRTPPAPAARKEARAAGSPAKTLPPKPRADRQDPRPKQTPAAPSSSPRALRPRRATDRGLQVWPPLEWSLDLELADAPEGLAFGPTLPGFSAAAATIARLAKGGGDILIGVSKVRTGSTKPRLRLVGVSDKAALHFLEGLDRAVRSSFMNAAELRFQSVTVPLSRIGQVVIAIRVLASPRPLVFSPKAATPKTPPVARIPGPAPRAHPGHANGKGHASPRVLTPDELAAYKASLPPSRDDEARRSAAIREALAWSTSATVGPPSQYLDWEVLPPGETDSVERAMGGGGEWLTGAPAPQRIKLLLSLKPLALYRGLSLGQRVYLVALFPRVAVADAGQYGNALYYYRCSDDSWKRVFRKDKIEARRAGAQRLFHTGEWEERVRRLVGK